MPEGIIEGFDITLFIFFTPETDSNYTRIYVYLSDEDKATERQINIMASLQALQHGTHVLSALAINADLIKTRSPQKFSCRNIQISTQIRKQD